MGICCDHCLSHWPVLLLIIFLCSPICQSVCIHWVCLISFYNTNALEPRFLVGFTVRLPKYNNNNSKESERRLAQHVSPTNRRFIVSVDLFITTTLLTERVCCQHNWSVFSISQHEISLETCWMNRTLSRSSKDCSIHFNHPFPQKDQPRVMRSGVCSHSVVQGSSLHVSISYLHRTETILLHIWNTAIKDAEKLQ